MSARRFLGGLLVAALPLAAGCGAGLNTETDKERATPYVGSGVVGQVRIGGARLIVASQSPSATPRPSGTANAAQAYFTVAIVNGASTPDSLANITIGAAGASASPAPGTSSGTIAPSGAGPGSLALPSGALVQFGDPDLGGSGPTLNLTGASPAPVAGQAVTATLTFANAGSVTIDVPVMDASDAGTSVTSTPWPPAGSTYQSPSPTPYPTAT